MTPDDDSFDLCYPSLQFDAPESPKSLGTASLSSTTVYPVEERIAVLPSKIHQESDDKFRACPDAPTHWTAQSVLQWIESMASAAETAGAAPIVVHGVRLSEPSPPPVPTLNQNRVTGHLHDNVPQAQTKRSLFADMEQRDPDGWWSMRQLEGIARLVQDNSSLQQAYRSIHARFMYTFDRIMEQQSRFGFEQRYLLDSLYQDTIAKLQDLLESETTQPILEAGPMVVASTESPEKKDFPTIMTSWLVNNWTNPYPDEEGLVELAHETGTNPSIVSNWLINARTRKWRPAIVKASKHTERPACLLLEDSINIFSGVPLRQLDESAEAVYGGDTSEADDCSSLLVNAGAFYPPTKRWKQV